MRTGTIIGLLLLLLLAGGLWLRLHQRVIEAPAAQAAERCGVERWAVKTLADPAAARIDYRPRAASPAWLRRLPAPEHVGRQMPRQRPYEFRVYRVRAQLQAAKQEEDGDIHLVIAQPGQPGQTVIVELPADGCVGSRQRAAMARARRALLRSCPRIGSSRFVRLRGQATLQGVAFFDLIHGQRGVAPNGIELHPLLRFSGSCRAA